MEVRQPQSVDEYREGEYVIAAAWRAAFDEIVSEDAIRRVDEVVSGSELVERFHRLDRSDDTVALIAQTGDRVVGTASVAWGEANTKEFVDEDEAELVTLYVDPDRWDEGIGSTLVGAAVDRLPPETNRLVLETFVDNEIGRRFYESQGFEDVGSWTFEIAGEAYPTVVYARSI